MAKLAARASGDNFDLGEFAGQQSNRSLLIGKQQQPRGDFGHSSANNPWWLLTLATNQRNQAVLKNKNSHSYGQYHYVSEAYVTGSTTRCDYN
ncbi:hypothetical protein Dimus_001855 [Dionaea muscipula]